jgi:small-conductance mechanosensitive channel
MKREWSSRDADRWTREDTLTVILSPLVYILLLVGSALSLLLVPVGFFLLGAGVALMLVMIAVIDPKLSAISRAYEEKQKEYLEELERKVRWEDENGD